MMNFMLNTHRADRGISAQGDGTESVTQVTILSAEESPFSVEES